MDLKTNKKSTLQITRACERVWKAVLRNGSPVSLRDGEKQSDDGFAFANPTRPTSRLSTLAGVKEKERRGGIALFTTRGQVMSTNAAVMRGANQGFRAFDLLSNSSNLPGHFGDARWWR